MQLAKRHRGRLSWLTTTGEDEGMRAAYALAPLSPPVAVGSRRHAWLLRRRGIRSCTPDPRRPQALQTPRGCCANGLRARVRADSQINNEYTRRIARIGHFPRVLAPVEGGTARSASKVIYHVGFSRRARTGAGDGVGAARDCTIDLPGHAGYRPTYRPVPAGGLRARVMTIHAVAPAGQGVRIHEWESCGATGVSRRGRPVDPQDSLLFVFWLTCGTEGTLTGC